MSVPGSEVVRPDEGEPGRMSIHEEAVVKVSPAQVYEFLTNGAVFAAATEMPAQMSDREGEPFSLFGGRVEGRQIELVPGQRVVQAWRFGSTHPDEWEPGVYSVIRFTMHAEGDATRFVIDHEAIPPQWEDHIQSGYSAFYQDPLTRHYGG